MRYKIGDILQWVNRWYMHRPQTRTHTKQKKTHVKSQQFILRLGQNLKQYWVSCDFINIIHLTTVMYYKNEHHLCAGFGWTLVFDAHNLTFVLDHHSVYFDRISIVHWLLILVVIGFTAIIDIHSNDFKKKFVCKRIRFLNFILYSASVLHVNSKIKICPIDNFVRP